MGEMIEFPSNGKNCLGYLATPDRTGPGVVVIQEWWGLVDHIKEVCDRFAAEGFVALAPDLFHGETTKEPDEAGKMMMALEIETAAREMGGAVDYLLGHEKVEPKKIGSVGFCMGGALSLVLATRKPIDAAVTFYGIPFKGEPEYGNIQGPVLGHFAENDDWASPENADALFKKLNGLGLYAEYTVYPGTDHAFFNDTRPEVHDKEAADRAWQSTLAFYRQHLS